MIIAIGGGFWFYKSSTAPITGVKPSPGKKTPENPVKSTDALGAQPPHMLGSPTAAVTIEEFADFQCPQCAAKYPMAKEIISAYGNRIKFIYRNNPLAIPAHDKAYSAAVAAEAAGLQDESKFWAMENQLFTNQSSWTAATDFPKILEDYAQKIGLDVERFKNDMAGIVAKNRVDADLQRGRGLGVNSTPSFFINGKAIPFEQVEITMMRQIIDAELLKAQSGSTTNQPAPANGATNTNTTNK